MVEKVSLCQSLSFLKTNQFKNLNVGIDIDEGFSLDSENVLHVSYAEKSPWIK